MLTFKRKRGFNTSEVWTAELVKDDRYVVCRPRGVSGWTAQYVTSRGNVMDVMRGAEIREIAQAACVEHLEART